MTLIHAFEKHLKKPCNYHLVELHLNAFIFFKCAKEEVYRNKVRIITLSSDCAWVKGISEIMVQHLFIIKESSIRRKISQLD